MRVAVLLGLLQWLTLTYIIPTVANPRVLVTNSWAAHCPYLETILIADPYTGELVADLPSPAKSLQNPTEAKPYYYNGSTIVAALWGGEVPDKNQSGVAFYNMKQHRWDSLWFLPDSFETGSDCAHSLALLPDGYIAIAVVGKMDGKGDGFVALMTPRGQLVQQLPLTSCHGVEWDRERLAIFAVGLEYVQRYSYDRSNHRMTLSTKYRLPNGPESGHDLRQRRSDTDFLVVTSWNVYILHPDDATCDREEDGVCIIEREGDHFEKIHGLPTGIKSIDEGKGVFEWNHQFDNYFHLFDIRNSSNTNVKFKFCHHSYKAGRFLLPELNHESFTNLIS